MAISDELLQEAVRAVTRVEGLAMDENDLVEDVFLLAYAFPEEEDFKAAVASTCKAMAFLIGGGRVKSGDLKYEFEGWHFNRYLHRAEQGVRALCRIMFKESDGGIEVKGFGRRRIPNDFYGRMGAGRMTAV